MRVFIAGGSGTIGIPLVRGLVASGHQVSALTRSPGKQEELRALGAAPVVANALDCDALIAAVDASSSDSRNPSTYSFAQRRSAQRERYRGHKSLEN